MNKKEGMLLALETNKKCYEFARLASGEQESETLVPRKKKRKGKIASYTSTFRNPLNNVWTQSMDCLLYTSDAADE